MTGGPGKWGSYGRNLSALSFEFRRTECRLHIEDEDFSSDLYAGMDGTYHVSYVRGERFAASACWEEENVLSLVVRALKGFQVQNSGSLSEKKRFQSEDARLCRRLVKNLMNRTGISLS